MLHSEISWRAFRPAEGFYNAQVLAPRGLPVRTFLPTGYEPNYPYPLVVFLHGRGSNEEQVLRLAPRLSRRNFICIGLRGTKYLGRRTDGRRGFGWGQAADLDSLTEDYVFRAVELTQRNYHVHSERIFLAGIWEGATLAYRLGLRFPDRFGGVISLNGARSRTEPLLRYPEVRQLRVFIGHGIANSVVPLSLARRDYRLFYAAGMPLEMHTYPTNHRLHSDMLRDVNRWIIRRCNEE
jgi:phospholipase/carboxylesterase